MVKDTDLGVYKAHLSQRLSTEVGQTNGRDGGTMQFHLDLYLDLHSL